MMQVPPSQRAIRWTLLNPVAHDVLVVRSTSSFLGDFTTDYQFRKPKVLVGSKYLALAFSFQLYQDRIFIHTPVLPLFAPIRSAIYGPFELVIEKENVNCNSFCLVMEEKSLLPLGTFPSPTNKRTSARHDFLQSKCTKSYLTIGFLFWTATR